MNVASGHLPRRDAAARWLRDELGRRSARTAQILESLRPLRVVCRSRGPLREMPAARVWLCGEEKLSAPLVSCKSGVGRLPEEP